MDVQRHHLIRFEHFFAHEITKKLSNNSTLIFPLFCTTESSLSQIQIQRILRESSKARRQSCRLGKEEINSAKKC